MPSKPIINYTNREYESIRQDLVNHIKTYYPETYKDFNAASFGAIALDLVSYVSDNLSFYLDYQVNESFITTAVQYENILKVARQMGFKIPGSSTAHGTISLFLEVPSAGGSSGPDPLYLPTLKKGSMVLSSAGKVYSLNEDVDFSTSDAEIVVAKVSAANGVPTSFAVKKYGQVISGQISTENFSVTSVQKFLTLSLSGKNISEIISVIDSQGNEYYEVPFLSQNIVHRRIKNESSDKELVPYKIREISAARRFIVERDGSSVVLVFGSGSPGKVTDPKRVILNVHAKDYIADDSFDPSVLIESDKFGIAPSNTNLQVRYRKNTIKDVNSPAGSLINTANNVFEFQISSTIDATIKNSVVGSLEITNEEPIVGGVDLMSYEEIRRRSLDAYATQNRAVTRSDYLSIIYRMDPKLGSIFRANVVRDSDSFKRNLNVYAISIDGSDNLVHPSTTLKNNLKKWLASYKMLNDTVDILNAKVVNIGINFEIISSLDYNKYDVLIDCIEAVKSMYGTKMGIGEPFYLTDIYKKLNSLTSVIDTKNVEIILKDGTGYGGAYLDIKSALSIDGRYIDVADDIILEIKYLDDDIKGVII